MPPNPMWQHINMFTFSSDPNYKRIVAAKEEEKYFFIDKNSKKFRWIAYLKDSVMLSIHQKIFANMSRLGVDEFEWLRRNQQHG
jgi:hypothetical protein